MTYRIAINGFGRIGRLVLRAALQKGAEVSVFTLPLVQSLPILSLYVEIYINSENLLRLKSTKLYIFHKSCSYHLLQVSSALE